MSITGAFYFSLRFVYNRLKTLYSRVFGHLQRDFDGVVDVGSVDAV